MATFWISIQKTHKYLFHNLNFRLLKNLIQCSNLEVITMLHHSYIWADHLNFLHKYDFPVRLCLEILII